MKHLSCKICLVIAALLESVSFGFALPDCPGKKSTSWNFCVGAHTYANGNKYFGEWKDGKRHGQGIEYYINGTVSEGIYKNDLAQERHQTSYSLESSLLKISFKKLSMERRKLIQSNLKILGLYKSSIDGLYGKGTEGALTAFNEQSLDRANLRKSENILKLLSAAEEIKEELYTKKQIERQSN